MAEGGRVSPHVLKMIGYIESLKALGFGKDNELAVDLILQSFPDSYSHFRINYIMNGMENSLFKLLNMLTIAEQYIKKATPVLPIDASVGKAKVKTKAKSKLKSKPLGNALEATVLLAKMGRRFAFTVVSLVIGKNTAKSSYRARRKCPRLLL